MNNLYRFFTVAALAAFTVKSAHGQNILSDTMQQHAYDKIVAAFYQKIGPQSRLYNGPEYTFHPNTIKGNAYFHDDNSWRAGTVFYDGVYYDNARLMYDIYLNTVALLLPNNFSMVRLLPESLDAFTMGNYTFVNFHKDIPKGIKAGIYLQLYSGKVVALGKYSKSLQSTATTSGPPQQFFKSTEDYYIKKDSIYYDAGSEGNLLKAFNDKKRELKQFIEERKIKFRKNPEQAIVMIAAEYDRLTN